MFGVTAFAIVAGATVGYFSSGEGSVAIPLVLGAFMLAGAWTIAWWLMKKTGLSREPDRSQAGKSVEEFGKDRQVGASSDTGESV
jgi:hypothetical protein